MKAALVDCFKSDKADILVSTEAGGEGINLQFCSVLINYDLPWNPQKVEQRIGRVHRYGQKNDVVVVNFVNRKNPADQRVFQLLNEKLKLFEGVFGASDEILGAIEGNIDIERRIYDIYQKCRTDAEIEQEFDQLQESLKDILDVREAEARQSIILPGSLSAKQKAIGWSQRIWSFSMIKWKASMLR
ncbi:helicase [Marinobacter sp. ELB17]|nr:helicase [Marinobacter sp. ELB17]